MNQAKPEMVCDGCGQLASPEHVARRFRRLEWTTRFRPVHINTVLLGAVAPLGEADFFYSPEGAVAGEAALLAQVAGFEHLEQPKEQLQSAFQRAGFFATHVLECPLEEGSAFALEDLLTKRLPATLVRIRRSLRPRRVAVISRFLDPFVARLIAELPGCKIVAEAGRGFALDAAYGLAAAAALRSALAPEAAQSA
jgi:hypothetical protein